MSNTTTQRSLESFHLARYGVSIYDATPISIIWAAEKFAREEDLELVKKAIRSINRKRERMGKMPAYPDFGTLLF